ncbi:MAG: DUF3782 domain-containing protein, partial [Microcystis aeruginosa]
MGLDFSSLKNLPMSDAVTIADIYKLFERTEAQF